MPLSFLNPGLLLGLLAAAVPVIIHFLSRRRRRRVAFSDLRFLQDAESRQARRRGLQRWLLLLLRVLIICCLALAAARPHWGGLPGGGGRAVLFILDGSASMQAQETDGGTRFAAAVASAGAMMRELPADAVVHALVAAASPRPLFATWLPAGQPARTALDGAAVTDGPCDLAAALREAARLARRAPVRPCEVVLLSDLQAVAWPDLEEAAAELADAGGRLLIRRLGDGVPGGGILGLELPGRTLRVGETVEVGAVVRPEREGQAFWLELDGRRVAQAAAPPGAASAPTTVAFTLVVPDAGLHLGRVGKDHDRLPADDVLPFVLPVPGRLRVLLAHGPDRDDLGRGGWRYLAQALDPGGRGDGLLQVRPVAVDSMSAGDLASCDLLVLVDVGAPGRRLGGALRDWLAGGGALLLAAGDQTQGEDLRDHVLPLLGLPGAADWRARSADQAERARVVDPAHPILAGLGDQELAALAAARWRRYFAVDEGEARVVLAADSGAPLLLEGELGAGRWVLWPFHLRRDATDLMLNPLFLPLAQRTAVRLAWDGRRHAAVAVGRPPVLRLAAADLRLRPGGGAAGRLEVMTPPAGEARPAVLAWQGGAPTLSGPPAERAGFHVFRADGDTIGVVAAAVPAAESEPAVLDPDDLAGRLRAAGLREVVDLGAPGGAGLSRAMAGHDLSRWLLAAALLLMLLEPWYGRRVRAA